MAGLPLRQVVYTRYKCYWNAKKLFIARRAELYRIIDEFSLKTNGPNMAIFHSDYLKQFSDAPEDSEGDLEICMKVVEPATRCPHCRNLGGIEAVSTIHVGHYSQMEPAYHELEQWAHRQGIELRGVSIEEYLVGATMTNNEDNYVTRIYLPLAGSEI
jgi:effector-binding domain-containing protein